jgi:serine/arginine repetitive matrix protein 2
MSLSHCSIIRQRDAEAVSLIEEAVKNAPPPAEGTVRPPPFLRGDSRRLSSSRPASHKPTLSGDDTDSSWRKKEDQRTKPSSFVAPPPSALEQSLAEDHHADLEVVDFSSLGTLVGIPEDQQALTTEPDLPPPSPERRNRPHASDFFGNSPPNTSAAWRKQGDEGNTAPEDAIEQTPTRATMTTDVRLSPSYRAAVPVPPAYSPRQSNLRPQPISKDVTVSAFDDTLSKIRGAMQSNETKVQPTTVSPPSVPSQQPTPPTAANIKQEDPRWIPPALRGKPPAHRENFDATGIQPPRSPKPAWNTYSVRLPSTSLPVEILNKRQLALWNKNSAVRPDVSCYDPPVEDGQRRDFSLQDLLFGKPMKIRGKFQYKVHLPKTRNPIQVSVPTTGSRGFGKPLVADSAQSWRKSISTNGSSGLDPTSRSPPPHMANISHEGTSTSNKSSAHVRLPSQTKVPVENLNVQTTAPTVSFTVTSELDMPVPAKSNGATPTALTPTKQSLAYLSPDQHSSALSSNPSTPTSRVVGKLQDDLVRILIDLMFIVRWLTARVFQHRPSRPSTPPRHNAHAWGPAGLGITIKEPSKESPSRGPDPEHLKAVWSQTSNKPSVNSLEGIGDDLPGLPFTLNDVKSEDGETPPPTAVPSSRMSIHDVRRAFQQVPTPSNSGPSRSTSSSTAPVARPTQQNFPQHPPPFQPPNIAANPAVRQPFPTYAPPPQTSPSPSIMYAQPQGGPPNRMPGPPMYGQAMWVPMMGGPPPGTPGHPQTPNMGGMRPIPSPYPGQMMAYGPPPPQGAHPIYMQAPAQMGPPPPQGNGRGQPMPQMMSPHMRPMAMYPGSPGPVMMSPVPPRPPSIHPQSGPPPAPQYSAVPSFTGVRPTW